MIFMTNVFYISDIFAAHHDFVAGAPRFLKNKQHLFPGAKSSCSKKTTIPPTLGQVKHQFKALLIIILHLVFCARLHHYSLTMKCGRG